MNAGTTAPNMFTVEQRDGVRARLLELAEADPDVVGAAITGSYVSGDVDEWSDVDVALGIRGELPPALERWTRTLRAELGTIHHWDLPYGSTIYRVFLLPEWLQVDIAFTPASDFGPRGPNWRTVFGETLDLASTPPPPADELIGLAWLFVRHARVCIARDKPWQAVWCVSAVRDNVLALACLRLGYPIRYARGVDLLPGEVTLPLQETLIRSLDREELTRALAAAANAYLVELDRTDPALAERLRPMVVELLA